MSARTLYQESPLFTSLGIEVPENVRQMRACDLIAVALQLGLPYLENQLSSMSRDMLITVIEDMRRRQAVRTGTWG